MVNNEQRLKGGNTSPEVVRIGETVHRRAGPWTPAVHHLLTYLADRDYEAPRPLGFDEQGREVLTYIPGECVHPHNLGIIETDKSVRRAGSLIAGYHIAQTDYVPPVDAAWQSEGRDPTGSTEVLAHNDFAAWNLITGPRGWVFIDWDTVAPGRRMWDLAWALQSFVGLWPGSPLTNEGIARRIEAFCDGAKVKRRDRPRLLEVVIERTLFEATRLHDRARGGDPRYQLLVEEGHADVWQQASDHVAANHHRWSKLLQD